MSRLGALLACAVSVPAGAGQVVVLVQDGVAPTPLYAGTRDVRISDGADSPLLSPDANYDSLATDYVDGYTGANSTLMRFDLTSAPAGKVLSGAQLVLNVTNTTTQVFPAWSLSKTWSAGSVTWLTTGAGTPWAAPGARGAADRGSEPLFFATGGGAVVLTFTDAGTATVRGWLGAAATNLGFIIAEEDAVDSIRFDSCSAAVTTAPMLRLGWADGGSSTFRNGAAGYNGCTDAPIGTGHPAGGNANGMLLATGGPVVMIQSTSFIRFDFNGTAPPNALLVDATLELYVGREDVTPVEVHQMTRSWTEAATWTTFDGVGLWADAGATGATDRSPLVISTFVPGPRGTVHIPLGDAGVALVQGWIDNTLPNDGFALVPTANSHAVLYRDREGLVPSERPALRLVFGTGGAGGGSAGGGTAGGGTAGGGSIPEHLGVSCGCQAPDGAVLLALALLAALRRRRS